MFAFPSASNHGIKLLSIEDVSSMTGLCRVSASRVMSDSGGAITLRRRKYVLEDRFLAYLRSLEEVANG